MAAPKVGNLQSETICSVCLELVDGTHERSTAKLICGHKFHLDCIGSAFNAKGSMQCPNCRRVEHGDWLYGNGRPHLENSLLDNLIFEEELGVELEMLTRVSELVVPDDIWHSRWCPYEETDTHLVLSIGYSPNTEVVVGVLVDENLESTRSVQPSPYARAQAPVLDRRARVVEGNVGVTAASPARMQHAAAYQQHSSPIQQRGRRQSPAAVVPNRVVGGVSMEEGSAGHSPFWISGHDGRSSLASVRRFQRRAESGHLARTTSAVQGAVREAQPRSNTFFGQRRRGRMSRFGQNPSEPEGQRWASSAPFGPTYDAPVPSLHALPLPFTAEDLDLHPSRSFYHPR